MQEPTAARIQDTHALYMLSYTQFTSSVHTAVEVN